MTVEEAVYARVASLSAVTALVGARVYLDKTPQDPTYPLVLVQSAGDHRDQHLRGPSGVGYSRVQVEARAHENSGVDAYEVADLFAAIDGDGLGTSASGLFGWAGTIGSPGFEVMNCAHRGSRDRFYDAEEVKVLRMVQDYWVTYRVP